MWCQHHSLHTGQILFIFFHQCGCPATHNYSLIHTLKTSSNEKTFEIKPRVMQSNTVLFFSKLSPFGEVIRRSRQAYSLSFVLRRASIGVSNRSGSPYTHPALKSFQLLHPSSGRPHTLTRNVLMIDDRALVPTGPACWPGAPHVCGSGRPASSSQLLLSC